jgi:hypothetical protein
MFAEIRIEDGFYVVRVYNSTRTLLWSAAFETKNEEIAYGLTLGMPRHYIV